jgi:hypothetical protein
MKKEMDDYRLNHPVYSKMAGSGKPFLFGKDIFGGTSQQDSHPVMRYGQDANEPTRFDAIGAEHVAKALHKSDGRDHPLVDVKSRDIAHLDPETGWNMTPNVGAFSDKPTRPRKLVKHDFLGKTSSGAIRELGPKLLFRRRRHAKGYGHQADDAMLCTRTGGKHPHGTSVGPLG